jgi:hypothetical protein
LGSYGKWRGLRQLRYAVVLHPLASESEQLAMLQVGKDITRDSCREITGIKIVWCDGLLREVLLCHLRVVPSMVSL